MRGATKRVRVSVVIAAFAATALVGGAALPASAQTASNGSAPVSPAADPAPAADPTPDPAPEPAPSTLLKITGGKTSTVSSEEAGKTLLGAGILPLPVKGGTLDKISLSPLALTTGLPITGGTLDQAAFLAGDIRHKGGLTFISIFKLRSVTVSDFVVHNDASPRLVATVNNDPRQKVTLFSVDLSGVELGGGENKLVLGNVGLVLTEEGAKLLNDKLRATVFKAGLKFGTSTTTIEYTQG